MTSSRRAAVLVTAAALVACGAQGRTEIHDLIKSDGELRTDGEVTFRVRPLAGPGSKGPHELAPESAAPLAQVRAVLEANPGSRLRIEVTVNPVITDAMPEAAWSARLANQVAGWLVARGVDCHRLDAIGFLGDDPAGPAEKVRFFALGRGPERPDGARADPCAAR